ncbi:MAG: thioredoxin family protein [Bacteroidota bacterium]
MTQITYYKSEDCDNCKAMRPIINKLRREGHDIKVVDLDTEYTSTTIRYVPTTVICKEGKCKRVIGAISEKRLRNLL